MKTLILLFFINNLAYAVSPFFSSKIIGTNFITLIVNKDIAILRVLNSGFETGIIDRGYSGKSSYVKGLNMKDATKLEPNYDYYIPDDKCYYLQNFYKVCTKKGKVISLVNNSPDYAGQDDIFFNESSDECNLFKFEIAYQLFTLQNNIPNKQYQLIKDGYPDFIKLVIIDYKHLFNQRKISTFSSDSDLRAFFVSSDNDMGCIPYINLKLYSDGDAQIYKMHVDSFSLLGETNISEKEKKPFLVIDKSKIIAHDRILFKE